MSKEDVKLIWEARISPVVNRGFGSDGNEPEDDHESEPERPETGDERWDRLHRDHPDVVAGYRKGLGPGYEQTQSRAQAEYDKQKHNDAGEAKRPSPKERISRAMAKISSNYDEFGLGTFEETRDYDDTDQDDPDKQAEQDRRDVERLQAYKKAGHKSFEEDDDPLAETEGSRSTRETFTPVNSLKEIQEILPKFMQQHYTGEQFDSVQRSLYNAVANLHDIIEYNEYESRNPGYGKDER